MIISGPTPSLTVTDEVVGEVPVGAIDGVNDTFVTNFSFQFDTEQVYLNGVRQNRVEDYTVTSPTTIVFVFPPHANDLVLVDYVR